MGNARIQWIRARNAALNPLRRIWLATARGNHPGPLVLANSFPKSGTYLLEHCLTLFPDLTNYHRGVFIYGIDGRKGLRRRMPSLKRMGGGTFVQSHLGYSDEAQRTLRELGMRHVLILRDPRDVVVSHALFHKTYPHLPHHRFYASLPDDESRIRVSIEGSVGAGISSLSGRWQGFLGWLEYCNCIVRYEDLVGGRGGGSDAGQRKTVARIADYIGIELSADALEGIAPRIYSDRSRTFRRGQIGDWTNYFSPETRDLFKWRTGDLLQRLGYEEDESW